MSKLYPIGIQNFESLRKDGYLYVDKTRLIYQLVKTGRYYFLSRPRRFGKSLLISTLEAYYQGKKELFEGLTIEQLEKDWIKHPILHLDLNIEKYDTPESLDHILNDNLEHWESLYGTRPSEVSFSLRFAGIIQRAYEQTGQRVVILVDEYDKPMLQAIGNEELQKYFRNTLKPFYGVLKSKDGCIKLGFLTGVTKFGKISIFSDLNNLIDISMDEQYVELCGITEKEIHDNMEEDLYILADKQKMTYEEVCTELKECYDGYHFVEDSIGIYNPFSLLNTFYKMKFGSYWFETGTPTYLVELLKKDYRLMSEDEAARLSAHFRSKVAEARRNAKDSAGMVSFYQIMKDTLDYRKWFEFQLFSQKNGERQKELTNSVFGTFSGGEKAMSMYVPLFSAVVAKYQGGREDAPRLISLDEAFAGVDNKNIRDMFRLMTEFRFDFIINSQVLWGDCDTLDALAIYQLIRPGNAKFVTVMPYLWNGHRKELLEHEEEVEQRGIELGQAEGV